jgi:hypothetical protein
MDAIQLGSIGSPSNGTPLSERGAATPRRHSEGQAASAPGTPAEQSAVAAGPVPGQSVVENAGATSGSGLSQLYVPLTNPAGRTFETAFKEALKVLRVPAPPSFQVDPANPLVIMSTETSGSSLLGRATKSLGGSAVDVSV